MNDKLGLRLLLGAMMFFQYAAWGAWTPLLSATLGYRLNATGTQIGAVYGVLWLACIFVPIFAGQLVDRFVSSQVFVGVAGAFCAVSAWMMASQSSVDKMLPWMWVWSLAFAPTIGITNSIVLYHLRKQGSAEKEIDRDYSLIRTAGTIGWIVASLTIGAWLGSKPQLPRGQWAPFEELQLAAVFGALMTVVAFLVPKVPPAKEGVDPFAFLKAFQLFKTVKGFGVFIFISLLICTEFQFYYVTTGPFLEQGLKLPLAQISPAKSIAQWAEIFCLAVLTPISLRKLGLKWTLVIGALAWPARYFIFVIGKPTWLVLSSMTLHGIGFAFVFIAGYLYVDRVAPKDIKASAQSLFTIVTLGLGNYLGTLFSGWWQEENTVYAQDMSKPGGAMLPVSVDWARIFIVPAILCLICAAAYAIFFKEPVSEEPAV